MIDELSSIVEQTSKWVDSTLATGLNGMSDPHRAKGQQLCDALVSLELKECGHALRITLETMEDDQVDALGGLIVVLELTRESLEISRLEHLHD